MKTKQLLVLGALLLVLSMITSTTAQIVPAEDPVSEDMCSTPDAYSNVIAWANEETGALHLDLSVNHFDKGDCVQFTLINADKEDDGSFADHDFDIPQSLNPDMAVNWHSEFNRSNSNAIVFVQMPDKDVALTAICGVPGHRKAGMEATIYVGSAKAPASSSDTGSSPINTMEFFVFFMVFSTATVFLRRLRHT